MIKQFMTAIKMIRMVSTSSFYLKTVVALLISTSVVHCFSVTGRSFHRIHSNMKHTARDISRYSISSSLNMVTTDSGLSKVSLKSLMKPQEGTQFVFVGGKGGVGKTSSSSAIAIALSDSGLRTLIVSTDPAHSLGDALDVNLRSGTVVPITTESNLWALEIDVEAALKDFQDTAEGLDSESLSASLGVPKEIIDTLGINDIASIFTNPPPGIDEIVALTKIFQYADEIGSNGRPRFDRIVIDTAPTGHTIRLLQLPEFLNSVTGKLIKFRAKLMTAVNTFKNLFGGNEGANMDMGGALSKLETLQQNVLRVKNTLKDSSLTQFVVVTIPTSLAVAESKRLVSSLQKEGIRVSSILCNQIITEDLGEVYMDTRSRGQRRCIDVIKKATTTLDTVEELEEGRYPPIEVTEVPYIDTEVTGIYGLKYFSQVAHKPLPKTATNPMDSKKLTIFGGKGGVGKTTSAASWGSLLSDSGLKTLVISTDPAHSLGDAFQENLNGNPRQLDTSPNGGQLWGMEIDPDSALAEFRELIKTALGTSDEEPAGGGGSMGGMGLPDFKKEISEMLSGVNDPPPGTDEIVAMTKIVTFLEEGCLLPNGQNIVFDRIVLDTAPTGHTLRMLQLPDFLQALIGKLKKVRTKAGGLGGIMNMMGGGQNKGESEMIENTPDEDKLEKFEKKMERLEEILHNSRECEFTVVTIPTEVASAETIRLLKSLRDENIGIRRLIINQVLPIYEKNNINENNENNEEKNNSAAITYLDRLRYGQKNSINELQKLADLSDTNLIQIPYFDMEVRTVYGLRVVGSAIFAEKKA
mmetsp:Transcript_157/g.191  ORF Transcript_157/g.191 Transcript_157/m.191 type:complete len:808 (-) Transcript_157:24-2447(-)